jgi:hypothetical protein
MAKTFKKVTLGELISDVHCPHCGEFINWVTGLCKNICAEKLERTPALIDDMARELREALDDLAHLVTDYEIHNNQRAVIAYKDQIDRVKALLARYEAGGR